MKIVKHTISLLFAFTCVTIAIADNYIPLVKEGAVWVYDLRYEVGDPTPTMKFWFEGDTIIEGEQYKREYIEMTFYYPEFRIVKRYESAWQEQDKKVFVWDGYGQKKALFYDFKLKKGDKVPHLNNISTDAWKEVTDEDTIEVNGIKRRRLEISYDYNYGRWQTVNKVYWVEGIGSSQMLNNPTIGGYNGFEYFEGDSCLFTRNEFFLPRNGSGTATEVRTSSIKDQPLKPSPIFDLQGRRLSEKPKRGMYIQNGKKYVIR